MSVLSESDSRLALCVTTMTVFPMALSCSKQAASAASPSLSRLEFGSSRITTAGSLKTALARPTRCLCPPDNWPPPSPTSV
mmetsp:Transcript_24712/g.29735  ORF Transcript_24712/g.29735 Transcript_24712/m.29735 type:complete len:81 (-) Transcript_24712:1441-1683(-)